MANTNPYLTFSSSSSFTLATANNTKNWDGILQYSTTLDTWATWDGVTILNSSDDAEHMLYMRGTGNTVISGSYRKCWTLIGTNISCIGNIENLLDYETVTAGEHPNMGESCYESMFEDCTSLTTAPELPATMLTKECYYSMFEGCINLTTAPELSATTLAQDCYRAMFYQCTGLTTAPELPAITLAEGCYNSMFAGCINLTTAPELPATTLANSCYRAMFSRCTNLTTPPELPATVLAENCYNNMFDRCTGLTTPPELPATTLADSCYSYMFCDCTNLTIAPELPATTLVDYCYNSMFRDCTSLTTAPELPATILKKQCYQYMFRGCTSLKLSTTKSGAYTILYRVPSVGDGTTATNALKDMFTGTGGTFTVTPNINTTYYLWDYELEAATLKFSSPNSFSLATANSTKNWGSILEYSTDLTSWSTWSGTVTLNAIKSGSEYLLYLRGTDNSVISGGDGKGWTFTGTNISCSGNIENLLDYVMVKAGEHPNMGANCYSHLFYNCASLTTAPKLPATMLASGCYHDIFRNCTGLTTAPELPATTLASECYYGMFNGCTNLTTAPELLATTLAEYCYAGMLRDCANLTVAPELPAMVLSAHCYLDMFNGCINLNAVPELFATTLAERCYCRMFKGCTNLTKAPELPATTLAYGCYEDMFSDCTSLVLSATRSDVYTIPYRIPSIGNGTIATDALKNMFTGTGGTFTGTPSINTTYYLPNPKTTAIKFSSLSAFTLATANNAKNWDGTLQYSTDLDNWNIWDGTTTLNSSNNAEHVLYMRGIGNSVITGMSSTFYGLSDGWWTLTGSNISCTGNIENLLNHATVTTGEHPNMGENCYFFMFTDCTSLITAPELPATTLTKNCYAWMFNGCTNLTTAPELPATVLAEGCYFLMFAGCTNLTTAPELHATTLAHGCYNSMFTNCTSLITPPELPATALADYCYGGMFSGCTNLTITPKLPATTLANSCYRGMFENCTNLTTAPELPAMVLSAHCYLDMFNGCTNLNTAPELPATALADYCYGGMFSECTNLTAAPELPATTLANQCYGHMFEACTSLIRPAELPATTLVESCYYSMFKNTGFTISETKTSATSYPYRIPLIGDGTTATDALTDMFSGVAGNIPTPEINKTYYISHRPIGGLKVKEVKKNKEIINIKHYHIYINSTLTENAYADSAFGAEALYDAYGMTDTEYNALTALID